MLESFPSGSRFLAHAGPNYTVITNHLDSPMFESTHGLDCSTNGPGALPGRFEYCYIRGGRRVLSKERSGLR